MKDNPRMQQSRKGNNNSIAMKGIPEKLKSQTYQ